MTRRLLLLLLLLIALLPLAGCIDTTAIVDELQAQANATPAPEATPPPPLTEPMYDDLAALYQYYNAVTFADTLTTLKERYGEPSIQETANGKSYDWVFDDGYGFAAAFYDDGRLRAKVLEYSDIRRLALLSGAGDLSGIYQLTKDYTFDVVKMVLTGKPMEIALISQDSSANPALNTLYVWANMDGKVVQILFDKDGKVLQVSHNLAN